MKILIACEFSGIVRRAFRARGHDAWSCDLLPAEDDEHHFQEDAIEVAKRGLCVREVTTPSREWCVGGGKNDPGHPAVDYHKVFEPWDMMIAHPPCTHLAVSGARWFPAKRADGSQQAAIDFFMALVSAPIPQIAIENPIGIMSTLYRRPDQIIQPWQHGHGEVKATCLWLKGLQVLVPSNVVSGREARVHREPPSPERWKNRSRTLPGIAAAMAAQWGAQITL